MTAGPHSTMAVYDYSTARPDPSLLDQGVMRYLTADTSNPKQLTTPELEALWTAQKPVGLVWEVDTTDYTGGHARGSVYGARARQQARFLGFPDSTPIYAAVDTRLNDAQRFIAVNYIQGFVEAAGNARVYGEAALIDACVAAGLISLGWCPETWGSSQHLALIQQVNQPSPIPGTDWNVTLPGVDWGGHLPGDPNMPFDAAEIQYLTDMQNALHNDIVATQAMIQQLAQHPPATGTITGTISGTVS